MNSSIIDAEIIDVDAAAEARAIKILNTLNNHIMRNCDHCFKLLDEIYGRKIKTC